MPPLTPQRHGLGWKRDLPDMRDFLYAVPHNILLNTLPPAASLQSDMPPVYDQGEIGSCTANAAAALVQFDRLKAGEAPNWVPSRLLIYFDVRAAERSIAYDAGAELRDVMKTLAYYGVCDETLWPYDIDPADPNTNLFPVGSLEVTHPPTSVYVEARKHIPVTYARVMQTLQQLKGCIVEGYPFMFGFTVYDSIYGVDGNPVVNLPMPLPSDRMLGGHAVCCVGYDDATRMFRIRNSWGPNVQDGGYFNMPYSFMTSNQLASDFWTIRRISS